MDPFINLSKYFSIQDKILYFYVMQKSVIITPSDNSKGAIIFKKMLEDKRAIHEHLAKGGKIEDLKDKFHFVKPLPSSGK
jgi:hypothetical protein